MGHASRRCEHQDALASRRTAVERAEAYVRAHMDTPVPLSALCRVVGLKERALRNAFYSVRGISPKRALLVERLEGVRRVLSDVGTPPTTVTGVATDYGFSELGRFAATYRKAFGETPSVTLRGARRITGAPTPRDHEGRAHACAR